MRFASLNDWLAWLETCHPQAIDLGLERIAAVASRMNLGASGSRQIAKKIITVGGTNGKGSCVATLEALFMSLGLAVGAYTSPHLLRYNERVRVGGSEVADAQLCDAFVAVDAARGDTSLTYFEFGTLAAFDVFARADLDVAILEVGLGGRLDAVNLLAPDVAVITSIDLDHTDWLGDTREAIAREKAGILREGICCVCGEDDPPASLLKVMAELHTRSFMSGDAFAFGSDDDGFFFRGRVLDGSRVQASALPLPALPWPSVAMALQAALLLPELVEPRWIHDHDLLVRVLSNLRLAGRCQSFDADGVEIIVDVAHNPAGARYLCRHLQARPATGRTLAVFTMLADKDLDASIDAMKALVTAWFVAELPGVARARPARDVADALFRHGIHMISVSKNLRQALGRARMLAQPGDRIVIFGSFHVAAELLPRVMKQQVEDDGEA